MVSGCFFNTTLFFFSLFLPSIPVFFFFESRFFFGADQVLPFFFHKCLIPFACCAAPTPTSSGSPFPSSFCLTGVPPPGFPPPHVMTCSLGQVYIAPGPLPPQPAFTPNPYFRFSHDSLFMCPPPFFPPYLQKDFFSLILGPTNSPHKNALTPYPPIHQSPPPPDGQFSLTFQIQWTHFFKYHFSTQFQCVFFPLIFFEILWLVRPSCPFRP